MADAPSTTGLWTTANALSIIVRSRLIEYANRQVVLGNLFTVDDTSSVRGLVHRVSRWPDLSGSVGDVTEGTDLETKVITATTAVITPAVVGIVAEVMDLLASSTPFAGLDPYVRQMAAAVNEELDDDIAALIPALNGGTTVGATTANLTLENLVDGLVVVQSNQAPGPYFAALHPRAAADLAISAGGYVATVGGGAAAGLSTPAILDQVGNVAPQGYMGTAGGIPVFSSARLPTATTGADRVGCVASADAITVARKWGMRTEMDRNIKGPATLLAANVAYGLVETADSFGVSTLSDA